MSPLRKQMAIGDADEPAVDVFRPVFVPTIVEWTLRLTNLSLKEARRKQFDHNLKHAVQGAIATFVDDDSVLPANVSITFIPDGASTIVYTKVWMPSVGVARGLIRKLLQETVAPTVSRALLAEAGGRGALAEAARDVHVVGDYSAPMMYSAVHATEGPPSERHEERHTVMCNIRVKHVDFDKLTASEKLVHEFKDATKSALLQQEGIGEEVAPEDLQIEVVQDGGSVLLEVTVTTATLPDARRVLAGMLPVSQGHTLLGRTVAARLVWLPAFHEVLTGPVAVEGAVSEPVMY